ncbi:hypothetical protein ACJ73_03395 [Blastomyces percursus]|uniref:Uncharacterized protein n=1 Tax=Blastomyces percursus TaxID=1658174 RepID=A0A1J9RC56_9EURO|nr:hypothetical protein ACJ73_03395 [Blastomyces percursus]
MKEKIRLIKSEINEIGLLLYSDFDPGACALGPTSENWRGWQKILNSLSRSGKRFRPNPIWISKICFAAFKNVNLEERIKRVREKIDDLREFSTVAFWLAQNRTDVSTAITEVEITRLLGHQKWINETSESLTTTVQGVPTRKEHLVLSSQCTR